jgi:adenylate cyclase
VSLDRVERKLAAILAADVAGYSRLMGVDEVGTLRLLKAHRKELIDPSIAEHRGRVVKTTGDGILVEFPSVVDAMRCAIDVQRGMVERNAGREPGKRIEFRIGVNVGDIIIDGDDIFGDGVNIAARLEGLAEPGGICISGRVCEDVRGKLNLAFDDMGEQQLKNIAWPVHVYKAKLDGEPSAARPTLTLPDKPSIAVLPFQNMSGDPEQEYFADGVVEEIITALSRFPNLFVIARNSSFTYKGRAIDVKQVGRELGVRYVLEGSVRRAGSRVRITGQLIDTATGAHLWADRIEGALEDTFDLQDRVTTSVVGAIAPKLERAEIERAARKPTERLAAYDYFLRGMAIVHRLTEAGDSDSRGSIDAGNEATRLFYKAIDLDPAFSSAYGMAAWCYHWRAVNGWMADRVQETAETARLARRAAELGKDDAVALCRSGQALARVVGNLEAGAVLIDRALALNPNLVAAWYSSGWVRVYLGEADTAIEHFARAMRLSPFDPLTGSMLTGTAHAHFFAGRYRDAAAWVEKALRELPNFMAAVRIAPAAHALAGNMAEAERAATHLRQLDPTLCVSNITDRWPWLLRRPEELARYEAGLRKAGVPER